MALCYVGARLILNLRARSSLKRVHREEHIATFCKDQQLQRDQRKRSLLITYNQDYEHKYHLNLKSNTNTTFSLNNNHNNVNDDVP